MGIFSRIGEIVNANINAMLDKAQDPIKTVKLMIHEMEDTLMEIKTSAAEVIADQKRLARSIRGEKLRVEDWESKAQLAVSKGRDDLAREALEQRLVSHKHVEEMEARMAEVSQVVSQYKQDITRLEEKLAAAKQRQRSMETNLRHAQNRRNVERKLYEMQTNEALSKIDSFEARIDEMNGEADIHAASSSALERKFVELEHENEIERELEALKKTASTKPTSQKKSKAE